MSSGINEDKVTVVPVETGRVHETASDQVGFFRFSEMPMARLTVDVDDADNPSLPPCAVRPRGPPVCTVLTTFHELSYGAQQIRIPF